MVEIKAEKIVAQGRPSDLIRKPESLTVQYLADYWNEFTSKS